MFVICIVSKVGRSAGVVDINCFLLIILLSLETLKMVLISNVLNVINRD